MFGAAKPPALQSPPAFGAAGATFGQTQPQQPGAFGAFGAQASSQPTFSLNQPSASSATPALFGAAGAPGLASATPQAGASSSFSFPSTFNSTPSMFGAQASTLGAKPAAATPSFGLGATTSTFGALGTAGGTGNNFGLGVSTPQLNTGLSPLGGLNQQQASTTPGVIPGFPPFPSDTGHLASSQVASDLQALDTAFTPKPLNNSYRFRHLFTNVVAHDQNVSLAARPPNVDAVQWQGAIDEVESLDSLTAGSRPPNEKLWPVGCGYGETSGFQELIVRAQSQEAEIMKQKEFLERVQGTIASITRKHEVDIQKAVQNCRLKYEEQTHKLIHIARFVDFLEHRAFRHPFTSQEDELAKKLTKLRNVFQDRSELTQLPKRIEALAALAREMKAHQKANGHVGQSTGQVQLASGSDKLVSTLSKYLEAVNKVQTNLQRDLLHLDIIEQKKKSNFLL